MEKTFNRINQFFNRSVFAGVVVSCAGVGIFGYGSYQSVQVMYEDRTTQTASKAFHAYQAVFNSRSLSHDDKQAIIDMKNRDARRLEGNSKMLKGLSLLYIGGMIGRRREQTGPR
ncbi:MAG: hypothetical protein ACK4PK_08740 [Alphaproteobacteria bacterium]